MGLSIVCGGLFALDWFGILMTTLVGMAVCILRDRLFLMRLAGGC